MAKKVRVRPYETFNQERLKKMIINLIRERFNNINSLK